MENKEIKERYIVTKPNPKNKKASTWVVSIFNLKFLLLAFSTILCKILVLG